MFCVYKFADSFYKAAKSIEFSSIKFPKKEHQDIKERLLDSGNVVTTRMSDELGKYKKHDICVTEWGQLLKVKKVTTYNDLSKHPFINELSKTQKDQISKYENFDVVYLSVYKPTNNS